MSDTEGTSAAAAATGEAAPAETEAVAVHDTDVEVKDEAADATAKQPAGPVKRPNQEDALNLVTFALAANALNYFVSGWVWIGDDDPPGESPVVGAHGLAFSVWSCLAIWYERKAFKNYELVDRSTVLNSFCAMHILVGMAWMFESSLSGAPAGPAVVHSFLFFAFMFARMYYDTTAPKKGSRGPESVWDNDGFQQFLTVLLLVNALLMFFAGVFNFRGDGWNGDIKDTKAGAAYFAWVCYCLFAAVMPNNNRDHALISVFMVHTLEVCVGVFKNAELNTHDGAIVLHMLFSFLFAVVVLADLMAKRSEPYRVKPAEPKAVETDEEAGSGDEDAEAAGEGDKDASDEAAGGAGEGEAEAEADAEADADAGSDKDKAKDGEHDAAAAVDDV